MLLSLNIFYYRVSFDKYPIYYIKNNEMGGACSIYGGDHEFLQDFGEETSGKETSWKT